MIEKGKKKEILLCVYLFNSWVYLKMVDSAGTGQRRTFMVTQLLKLLVMMPLSFYQTLGTLKLHIIWLIGLLWGRVGLGNFL